jgi:hypothetical protein
MVSRWSGRCRSGALTLQVRSQPGAAAARRPDFVPGLGAAEVGDDLWEPVRLIDSGSAGRCGDGVPEGAAGLGPLGGAQRSYAMDLLRWFRFVWAKDVSVGPDAPGGGPRLLLLAGAAGQAHPRRHGSGAVAGRTPITTRWSRSTTSGWVVSAAGRAADPASSSPSTAGSRLPPAPSAATALRAVMGLADLRTMCCSRRCVRCVTEGSDDDPPESHPWQAMPGSLPVQDLLQVGASPGGVLSAPSLP